MNYSETPRIYSRFRLTAHNEGEGVNVASVFMFIPVFVPGPPSILETVGKPIRVLGAAQALEQKR